MEISESLIYEFNIFYLAVPEFLSTGFATGITELMIRAFLQ